METSYSAFIEQWHVFVQMASIAFFMVAILLIVFYLILLSTKNSQVKKYEFAAANEIKFLWYSSLSVSIALTTLLMSLFIRPTITVNNFELVMESFLFIGIGVMIGYTLYSYITIYHPSTLEKRLAEIRFKPRISPKTGKPMRLFNEDEEDVHLTEEMIAHELEYIYDYDVWLDEETGYKLIERYKGHLRTLICDECRFRTMKELKEEIAITPTLKEPGLLKKQFRCSYCGHTEEKELQIAPLSESYESELSL